ncbi:unnamed protein product [Lymnaea stagnalis]|uniref:Thioredoxin domain-containing protein 12 n=1 Tax=Lymnaea stagnalis TaxID=6523 RepID=A0AAV2HUK1_LYMST
MRRLFVRLSQLGTVFGISLTTGTNDRGWGDRYDWHSLDEAFHKARTEDKPMMVVIHKMTCAACQAQKRWFSRSPRIFELSKNFVMVNLEVHEVPKNPDFSPDGHYVPRILFFTPGGRLMSQVKFHYNKEYQYTYPDEHDLARSMMLIIDKKV